MSTTTLWLVGSGGYLLSGFEMDVDPGDVEKEFFEKQSPNTVTVRNPVKKDVSFSMYWPIPISTQLPVLKEIIFRLTFTRGLELQWIQLHVGERTEPVARTPLRGSGQQWHSLRVSCEKTLVDSSLGLVLHGVAKTESALSVSAVGLVLHGEE